MRMIVALIYICMGQKMMVQGIDPMVYSSFKHLTTTSIQDEPRRINQQQKGPSSSPTVTPTIPIYRRRNVNARDIDYGEDHPFDIMRRQRQGNIHPNASSSKNNNPTMNKGRRESTYSPPMDIYTDYNPTFSYDDFLQDEWYDVDDVYDPYEPGEWQDMHQQAFNKTSSIKNIHDWVDFRPIRIKVDCRHLANLEEQDLSMTERQDITKKNEFIQYTVLPAAVQFWTKALMVYPVKRLFIDTQFCQYSSPSHYEFGITGADLMLYVISDPSLCRNTLDDGSTTFSTIAGANSCDWDQYDRPIGGVINFCYKSFDLDTDGVVSQAKVIRDMIDTAIHEIGHILGLRSRDMVYYYDRYTGKPRTPRPLTPSKDVWCVTGKHSGEMPSDVLKPAGNTLKMGAIRPGIRFYEVVTPTVKLVARNHFNCETMRGMRLENQEGRDCFGDHWEERLVNDEIMSALTSPAGTNEYLSPFTLAILEDSGWYRANFSMAKVTSFGHGAGCDFVNKPCIVNGNVPNYSQGFFCNSTDRATNFACDPSHTTLATCDLYDLSKEANQPEVPVPYIYRYFPGNPAFGPKKSKLADFCPIYNSPLFACNKPLSPIFSKATTFEAEKFGDNSRCFESNYGRPLCLEAYCDNIENAIIIKLGDEEITCSYEGEEIGLPESIEAVEGITTIKCPKKAVFCPELICPSDCSGKGKCNWNSKQCECFDEDETSANCDDFKIFVKQKAIHPTEHKEKSASEDESNGNDTIQPSSSGIKQKMVLCLTIISITVLCIILLS